MNDISEVRTYLGIKGDGKQATPFFSLLQTEKKQQYRQNASLAPHFKGKVPTDLFNRVFADETNTTRNKRINRYTSKAKSELDKALNSVMRLIVANKFKVNADAEIINALGRVEFADSYDFVAWLCSNVYRVRAYDPNGLVACQAKLIDKQNQLIAVEPSQQMPTEFEIYASEQIEYIDENIAIVSIGLTMYRIFTKSANFITDKAFAVLNSYVHNSDVLGVCFLGGKSVKYKSANGAYFEAYESDFVGLEDVLNDLAVNCSNQQIISSTAYVTRILYNDSTCDTCEGAGVVFSEEKGANVECGTCNGRGFLKIGINDDLHVSLAKDETGKKYLAAKPIDFAAPPKDVFEQTNYLTETALNELKDGLNLLIYQASTTSGISKEKDREPSYLFLMNASKALAEIAYRLLVSFAGYLSVSRTIVDGYIKSIEIIKPSHFALDDLTELETKATTNVANKNQMQRYNEQKDIIINRFGVDSLQLLAFDVACLAANYANLYLVDELINLQNSNMITAIEARNALQAYAIAMQVVATNNALDKMQLVEMVKSQFIK